MPGTCAAPPGWRSRSTPEKSPPRACSIPTRAFSCSPTSSSRASPPTPPNPGRAATSPNSPPRITDAAGVYPTSQLWFRKVGAQPGVSPPGQGKGGFHDLVGNVAEYVFDAPGANAVTKDAKVSVDSVNALIGAESKDLFVIGGSSLSPPEVPDPANPGKFIVNAFNVKQPVPLDFAQTSTGFSDVGFRLAYTAPVDSIADVLASAFKAPPYLPPSKTPR